MSSEVQTSTGRQRWIIPFVLMVSLVIAFYDRLNLAYAMPMLAEYYGWTDEELAGKGSLLLGAFYFSYGLSNIFLSAFAARLGVRRSLITIVFLFSIFTMLGAPLSSTLPLFIGTRILLGIGEGVHFPMMNTLMKQWFPLQERSRANAIWVFGGTLATITAAPLLVPIIASYGWKVMLISCGLGGMLITIPLLVLFIYNTPEESPRVSDEEAAYIRANLEKDEDEATDWSFLKMPLLWLAVAGAVLNNYCIYAILNWLPTYFVVEKGIDFEQLGFAASLPYVAGFFGFLFSAILGDKFNRRILLCSFGFMVSTVCVFLATLAPGIWTTIAAFSCATLFQSAYISQEFAIIQRILPSAVIGKGVGIYNGVSILIGGVGGTVLLGQIVSITGNYDHGFYSVVVATSLGTVVMFILSRFVKY